MGRYAGYTAEVNIAADKLAKEIADLLARYRHEGLKSDDGVCATVNAMVLALSKIIAAHAPDDMEHRADIYGIVVRELEHHIEEVAERLASKRMAAA